MSESSRGSPLPEHKRLIQLLGMMGSSHDGEVLNAARLAHKLARSLGGWEVVLGSAYNPLGDANRAEREEGWQAGWQEGWQEGFEKGGENADQDAYDKGFQDGVNSAKSIKATRSWRQWAKDRVKDDEDYLSAWEINFFGSFGAGRYAEPSKKQHAIFVRVAQRLDLELPVWNRRDPELAL
jgi:hypothetical protein